MRWWVLALLLACTPAEDAAVVPPFEGASPAAAPAGAAEPSAAGSSPVAEALTPEVLEQRRRALHAETRALVEDLSAAGRYDCCIEQPCATCAMRMGGCKCGHGLRNGEPVCEECAMMWRAGRGAEPGVDPASVRTFLEAQREAETAAKARAAPEDPRASTNGAACACPGHERR